MFINVTKKLWSFKHHAKVEAAAFFLLLPGFLSMITVPIFELEKACLVNLQYEKNICDNLNNAKYKAQCQLMNSIVDDSPVIDDVNISENRTIGNLSEIDLIQKVCEAEKNSQKVLSKLYAYRSPIGTVFSLIIVVFAGAWSDKHDIRKPFLVFPFIGEVLTMVIFLISAIYMESIPTDYAVIAAKVVPNFFGGFGLFFIGLTSYMTVLTKEEQRTARFGFFSMFMTVLGIMGAPLAGVIFKYMTYVQFFILALCMYTCGLLFTYFCIEDVKTKPVENDEKLEGKSEQRCMFSDFFDKQHIVSLMQIVKDKRKGNEKKILIMVILCHTIYFATHGEDSLHILFARTALQWTTEFSFFLTYTTTLGLIGTSIVTIVFVKYMKLEDATLIMISLLGSLISKPLIAISTSTTLIYVAATMDIFGHSRYIAIKSIVSKIVDTSELGRTYSIVGILDNIDLLLFTPIYSFIYYQTLDTFPGAIFLFSEGFLIVSLAILFFIPKIKIDGEKEAA